MILKVHPSYFAMNKTLKLIFKIENLQMKIISGLGIRFDLLVNF